MNILGVSCYYHDSAAALLRDGRLVAAAEEERFSRRKHDSGFPHLAIDFCLRQGELSPGDIDYVVFYEKPLARFERILTATLASSPRSWRLFQDAMIAWFGGKLWVKGQLSAKLGVPLDRVLFVDHHMAHAASSFLCSPFREAAILTTDGAGEWATATRGTATADWDGRGKNSISLTDEIRYPDSLGFLYSAFTAFLGFEVNEGEYKVMGMAPYGDPRFLAEIERLAHVAQDGSFHLDPRYFSYQHSTRRMFSRHFESLFGEPRPPDADFATSRTGHPVSASDPAVRKNQHYADIAASIQRFTEETLLRLARNLHESTGMDSLCLAGGVALNSVANGRLLRESGFRNVFIPPSPGDSGGAMGAALYAWHVLFGKPRSMSLEHAYWGQSFSSSEVHQFLDGIGARYEEYSTPDRLCERIAGDLLDGKVIGWFQGRFEWGPRALGNRSILADPRRNDMKEIVNAKIKFREPFRPFAPVVPERLVSQMFEGGDEAVSQYPTRFMLFVLPWKPDAGALLPAVNHMGTGRLQSIRSDWNPRYDQLVECFGQASGTPVLMNTSFNLRGEPIVTTPANAWSTFQRSGIDVLVMEDCVVRKEGQ